MRNPELGQIAPRHVVSMVSHTFSDGRLVASLLACLLLAYLAELGFPTFSSDYFHNLALKSSGWNGISADGRHLSDLIIYRLFQQVVPPSFVLLIGVVLLAVVGAVLVELWGITSSWHKVVAILLLATFPFWFESFSYEALRLLVPLAVTVAVFGTVTGGVYRDPRLFIQGFVPVFLSLLLYQSAAYFAAVVVLVWSAVAALRGEKWSDCVTGILVPKALLLISAMGVYVPYLLWTDSFLSQPADRLVQFGHLPHSFKELWFGLSTQLTAAATFFVEGTFLTPLVTKLIALAGATLVVFNLAKNAATKRISLGNAVFVGVILCLLAPAAHGVALILYPPWASLVNRVLIGYSAVYMGIFALTLATSGPRTRKAVAVMFAVAAAMFVYQANVWHQFLSLKNLADMDVAREISRRLKSDQHYRPRLPLVMLGTMTPSDYLTYRVFTPQVGHIGNSIIPSVYAHDWSKERLVMFFLPFSGATSSQISLAQKNAIEHGVWPAPDSVFIQDNVMTVVLSK